MENFKFTKWYLVAFAGAIIAAMGTPMINLIVKWGWCTQADDLCILSRLFFILAGLVGLIVFADLARRLIIKANPKLVISYDEQDIKCRASQVYGSENENAQVMFRVLLRNVSEMESVEEIDVVLAKVASSSLTFLPAQFHYVDNPDMRLHPGKEMYVDVLHVWKEPGKYRFGFEFENRDLSWKIPEDLQSWEFDIAVSGLNVPGFRRTFEFWVSEKDGEKIYGLREK